VLIVKPARRGWVMRKISLISFFLFGFLHPAFAQPKPSILFLQTGLEDREVARKTFGGRF